MLKISETYDLNDMVLLSQVLDRIQANLKLQSSRRNATKFRLTKPKDLDQG